MPEPPERVTLGEYAAWGAADASTAMTSPASVLTVLAATVEPWVPEACREAVRVATRASGQVVAEGAAEGIVMTFERVSEAVDAARVFHHAVLDGGGGDTPLVVRIALHAEEVGGGGDDLDAAVERARSLCRAAEPGGVLVSGVAAALITDRLGGVVAVHPVADDDGTFELVVSAPTRVGHGTSAPARRDHNPAWVERVRPAAEVTFVGRRDELGRLDALWRESCDGRRRAAFLRGEPGIGKTTLAATFAARAHAEGATVVYGRCDEEVAAPYDPIAAALGDLVATCPSAVLGEVGPLIPELARLVPAVAARVDEMAQSSRADPESQRLLLFESVVRLVGAASRHAPLVVVLDDLHWAAKPALLLLRHLVRASEPGALFILGTYRDTELGRVRPLADTLADLRRDAGIERLALGGLDEADIAALLDDVPTADRAAVARAVAKATSGNPLFVTQVIGRADVMLGDVDEDTTLPEGLREAVGRRLSALSAACNDALAVAAVIGPSFTFDVLGEIEPTGTTGDRLLDALEEAVAARVLVEDAARPGTYLFAHAVIRQTLLGELTAVRRARLHRAVAGAIERVTPSDVAALAHHFGEAALDGEAARAVDYALVAARRATQRLAYEEAIELLERAAQLVETDDVLHRRRGCDVLVALADARWRAGDVPSAKAAALRAAELATAGGPPEAIVEAAIACTGFTTWGTAEPAVAALCDRAVDVAVTDAAVRSRVLAGAAFYRAAGEGQNPAAAVLAAEALDTARGAGDPDVLTRALYVRAVTLLGSEHTSERRRLGEELLDLADTTRDLAARGDGLRIRAIARLELGDRTGFEADAAALEELAERLGSRVWRANVWEWRGLLALLDGRFDEVESAAATMLQYAGDDPNFVNVFAGQLLLLRQEQGRSEEMRPLVAAAAADNDGLVTYRCVHAHVLADLGELDESRVIFDDLATDGFAAVPRDIGFATSLCVLTDVCASLGDADAAGVLWRHLLPYAGQLMVVGWGIAALGAVDRYLGVAATTARRFEDAEPHLRAAENLERSIGARPSLVRTRAARARLLAARRAPGDDARLLEVVTDARADAERLGMRGVAAALSSMAVPAR